MKALVPEIRKLPKRSVLTITTIGNPNATADHIFPALYGTAYGTKFKVFKPKKIDMKIGACSAFWPDAQVKPKAKWTGIWNLEVPGFVKAKDLVQKDLEHPVKLKSIPSGTFAQVLFIGVYRAEGPTIKKLHTFIAEQGYRIAGDHEEVYLTKPGPKAKTIIRYRIIKQK